MIKIGYFKKYGNKKIGILNPFYLNTHFKKFRLNRFFFIHGNKKILRGDHAHKKCSQIFIPIKGRISIEVINKKKNKKDLFNFTKKSQIYDCTQVTLGKN